MIYELLIFRADKHDSPTQGTLHRLCSVIAVVISALDNICRKMHYIDK